MSWSPSQYDDKLRNRTIDHSLHVKRFHGDMTCRCDDCKLESRRPQMPSHYERLTKRTSSSASSRNPAVPTTASNLTMQSLRRTAVAAARTSRTSLPRQSRRFAHDEHAHGHPTPAADEPMGVCQPPFTPPRWSQASAEISHYYAKDTTDSIGM